MRLVFDLEGDGLREDIENIWCVVAKDIDNNVVHTFDCLGEYDEYGYTLPELFGKADTLIGHNILGYDLPVLTKFYGLNFSRHKIHDTYVVSQLLNPDRQLPVGCPPSTLNPLTGAKDKVGPHSLEAHGFRLGERKIHHHDWTRYSPEMLERCKSDVLITEKLYYDQLKELFND